MQSIPLTEFVANVGQIKAAAALRMSQGGISKALKAEREVYVIKLADGTYKAQELKPFPAQQAPKRSASNSTTPSPARSPARRHGSTDHVTDRLLIQTQAKA